MATVKFKGTEVHSNGQLPAVGSKAPDFTLVGSGLKEIHLSDYKGKRLLLNIFPHFYAILIYLVYSSYCSL